MKRFNYLIAGLLCLILAAGCTSSNSTSTPTAVRNANVGQGQSTSSNSKSTSTPTAASTPNKPVERMLAEIDSIYGKGDPVMSDEDIRVKRIRYLINSISAKTGDTPYDVANWTAKYTNMIRDEYGKQINNQDWLEYANKFVSTAPKMKYQNVCSIVSLELNK